MNCLNDCGPMSTLVYEGVEIDVCRNCIGVWLDDSELAEIVATKEREWPAGVIEGVLKVTGKMGVPSEEFDRDLSCPVCNQELGPVNYLANSGVIINPCVNGHGVWLDNGELAKIQIFIENWTKSPKD